MPDDNKIYLDIVKGSGYYPISSMEGISFTNMNCCLSIWYANVCVFSNNIYEYTKAVKIIKSFFPYSMKHPKAWLKLSSQMKYYCE